jgi:murein DD-endopeptidase MepM/ murein hydrolase activator NlpD
MSVHVEPPLARVAMRLAALAMVSAALAGCSTDVARFERAPSFAFAPSNTPPAEMTGSVRPAQAAPVARVESHPLPPSGGGYAQGGYQQSALPPPSSSDVPPPRKLAPPPQTASAPPPSAGKRKSGVHVVAAGETLGTLANKYRMSRGEIARANGMKATDQVRIGQRLTIPGVEQSRIRSTAAASEPGKPVRTAEAKPDPKNAATKDQKTAAVQRGAPPSNLSADKPPAERVERAALAQPAAAAGQESDGPAASGAAPAFRWPVRGRVIAGFGPKSGGQQNDGINLAVPEGTSVKAAEDGVVAYSGNELKGYGNLVLVRHSNGYVTAYAHASELKVKRGDKVKRGQIIALAGQTGGVNAPQLHFEVRKGSKPVDPMQYLTGN